MRKLATLIACAVLGLAAPAYSQTRAFSMQAQPADAQTAPGVQLVVVAELDSLPVEIRKQVNAAVSQASDEQLRSLRRSINAIPAASAALKAQGKTADEVLAAAIDTDGALVLITVSAV